MISLCINKYVLYYLEYFVFNKFTFNSNDFGVEFLHKGYTFFFDKPYFYQADFNSFINPAVFTFNVKEDKDGHYKLIIKCGKIKLRNDTVIKPINKKLEINLPSCIVNFNSSNLHTVEDDIIFFSVGTLTRLLFTNYKLSDNRTIHDEWIEVRDRIIRERKRTEELEEIRKLEEMRLKHAEELERRRIQKEQEEAKIDSLMGEEVF